MTEILLTLPLNFNSINLACMSSSARPTVYFPRSKAYLSVNIEQMHCKWCYNLLVIACDFRDFVINICEKCNAPSYNTCIYFSR